MRYKAKRRRKNYYHDKLMQKAIDNDFESTTPFSNYLPLNKASYQNAIFNNSNNNAGNFIFSSKNETRTNL